MEVIIDRFEGDYAVVELPDKSMINMPKKLLDSGAKEGDIVEITINKNKTAQRAKNILELANKLWE